MRKGCWREENSGLELAGHINQHKPLTVGFRIPAWISPFISLSEVAARSLAYSLSPTLELLKDLQNNYKAEPWEAQFERRTEDVILALCDDRPRGAVPGPIILDNGEKEERICAVLAAVDTQLRYFRYVIRAFGYGEIADSWLIQEGTAPNFEALDNLFWNSEYFDNLGRAYKVSAVIIDAMGELQRTGEVYTWAARNRGLSFTLVLSDNYLILQDIKNFKIIYTRKNTQGKSRFDWTVLLLIGWSGHSNYGYPQSIGIRLAEVWRDESGNFCCVMDFDFMAQCLNPEMNNASHSSF